MVRDIKRGLLFTLATMIVFGGGYHVILWAVANVAFPEQAYGSLVRNADGTILGSRLIAQKFQRPEYFYGRPSAVDFNAASICSLAKSGAVTEEPHGWQNTPVTFLCGIGKSCRRQSSNPSGSSTHVSSSRIR